jgi:hypothetical protein
MCAVDKSRAPLLPQCPACLSSIPTAGFVTIRLSLRCALVGLLFNRIVVEAAVVSRRSASTRAREDTRLYTTGGTRYPQRVGKIRQARKLTSTAEAAESDAVAASGAVSGLLWE